MTFINTAFIIVGSLIALIGLLSFLIPSLARIINAPGGPRLKAIVALITGSVFIFIGLIFGIPTR